MIKLSWFLFLYLVFGYGVMGRPRTRIVITCQNPDCVFFLKEESKDVVKHGFNSAGNQVYHCKRCGRFFC